jgi:hypothetical protein
MSDTRLDLDEISAYAAFFTSGDTKAHFYALIAELREAREALHYLAYNAPQGFMDVRGLYGLETITIAEFCKAALGEGKSDNG